MGYHWFTDIEATRQLASALVARLHADPTFRELMAAARAEYESVTTDVPSVAVPQQQTQSTGRAYRLDGTPATTNTRGIIIEDGQKRFNN